MGSRHRRLISVAAERHLLISCCCFAEAASAQREAAENQGGNAGEGGAGDPFHHHHLTFQSFDLAANGRELCVDVVETALVIGERASGRLRFVLWRTRGP
jgi:hypothetical protein